MSERGPFQIPAIVSGVMVALSLTGLSAAAWSAPVLQMQFSETGCGSSCPTPVTFSDGGSGILQLPSNTVFGDFKINGGQATGLVAAAAATPNAPNSDILDPGGNVLIFLSATATLTIKLTETGLVSQDTSVTGLFFDPSLTLSPGATATVATFADATDTAFGTATPIALTASSVPAGVTATNNADGSVTFVNGGTVQKSPQADSGDFIPVTMSPSGDFSVTEVITLTGPISATQNRLSGSFTADPPVYVPEPVTLAILGSGLAGIGATRLKRRRKS
jgi:hypothetical protein